MTTQTETRLVHLTDIHFPQTLFPSLTEFSLKRLFGFFNWHLSRKSMHLSSTLEAMTEDVFAQTFNHLIVSGDLVNLSLHQEYKTALSWMERFGAPSEVSFVPGNHDYYGQTPFLYPASTGTLPLQADAPTPRSKDLLPFMTSDDRGVELGGASGPDLPFVRVVNDVALIGLNSGVPTPLFKAYGKLNEKSLDALAHILNACKEAHLYRCVILHHPPLPGITTLSRGLQNDHLLQALLREAGAELVLYGHNHKQHHERLTTNHGVCHIVGTPSASIGLNSRYELARYNLFSIRRLTDGWSTKIQGRGLQENYGDVVDLGTTDLV
jgi:3',5'-cyclic AMP phosphodiesterase CpdA